MTDKADMERAVVTARAIIAAHGDCSPESRCPHHNAVLVARALRALVESNKAPCFTIYER